MFVVQYHPRRQHLAFIAPFKAGGGGQVRPGAVTAHCQSRRIEAQFVGMFEQPVEHIIQFLHRLWKPGLGRAGIVDTDHDHLRCIGIFAHQPVMGINREQHPASARKIEEGALCRDPLGPVQAHPKLAMAGRDHPFLGAGHNRSTLEPLAPGLQSQQTRLRGAERFARRVATPSLHRTTNEFGDFGVEHVKRICRDGGKVEGHAIAPFRNCDWSGALRPAKNSRPGTASSSRRV